MTEAPDDSALFHGMYDPAKARAYYLRTRQLKGRQKGSTQPATPNTTRRSSSGTTSSLRPSRRKELEAKKAALEKRLDRLREVLAQRVAAAKKRSGVDAPTDKDSSSPADTAKEKTSKSTKDTKPLTEAQKSEKRKASKEQYEKEEGSTLNQEVEQLQLQVQDILKRIKKAAADAQQKQRLQSEIVTAPKSRLN